MLRKTLRAFLCAVLLVALSSSLFAAQGIVKLSSNLAKPCAGLYLLNFRVLTTLAGVPAHMPH